MANQTLWMGVLTTQPMDFGPVDTYQIDGRHAFTIWHGGDLINVLQRFGNKTVRISIEEVVPLYARRQEREIDETSG